MRSIGPPRGGPATECIPYRHTRVPASPATLLLKTFTAQVAKSPVLVALGCQVTARRGRFNVERVIDDDQRELWGRITPLDDGNQSLLECERWENQWYAAVCKRRLRSNTRRTACLL